jgi:hypothetical protein
MREAVVSGVGEALGERRGHAEEFEAVENVDGFVVKHFGLL